LLRSRSTGVCRAVLLVPCRRRHPSRRCSAVSRSSTTASGSCGSGAGRAIRRTRSPSGGRSIGSDGRSEPHALEVEGRETRADLNARVAGALDELFADLVVVPDHVVHPGLLGGWVVLKPRVQGGHRMRLHANAALSLKRRERMARRVVEQGWSITMAAAAAEVSDRTCSKWVARYRAEGVVGPLDPSSAPALVANRAAHDPSDRGASAPAVHRPRDRRAAGSAAGNGPGDPQADRDGQARAVGLGARRAL
jgi:hypothetical protein